MSIQFDWQAGTENGEWETLARTDRRSRMRWLRRVPWWGWIAAGVILVSGAAAGFTFVQNRVQEANRQIGFQIQSVVDLQARAFADRDVELFMDQQDDAASGWFTQQRDRIDGRCDCDPVLPGEVEEVDLRGDIARVQVLEQQGTVRRARFYRQTPLGWKETAPRDQFFQVPVELRYGTMVFLYHRADEPYVDPLIEDIHRTVGQVCSTVDCPRLEVLQVVFATDVPPGQPPRLQGDRLVLPSPWLSGVPVEGTWSNQERQDLTYWVSYELAVNAVRVAAGGRLSALQRAIVAEYATWRSGQDPSRSPILGRVIADKGEDVLAEIMRDLPNTRSLSAFMRQWLSASPPEQDVAFLGA